MGDMFRKRTSRSAEIPTTSMADVAFLLLIFFLVATTIDADSGINMVLPASRSAGDTPPQVTDQDMLKLLVRADGSILIEGKPVALGVVRKEVTRHVMNNGSDSTRALSSDRAVVSLQTEPETSYRDYIGVLDEVWMAYRILWDAEARRLGFAGYQEYRSRLQPGQPDRIREKIKANISFAEPGGSGDTAELTPGTTSDPATPSQAVQTPPEQALPQEKEAEKPAQPEPARPEPKPAEERPAY